MSDQTTLRIAIAKRDWNECSKVAFYWMHQLDLHLRQRVAFNAIGLYSKIWLRKHKGSFPPEFEFLIDQESSMDYADAEFESAFLSYTEGLNANDALEQTKHFTSAIRSVVIAGQIDRWISVRPDQYLLLKGHLAIPTSTFLTDGSALKAAGALWTSVEKIFLSAFQARSKSKADQFLYLRKVTRHSKTDVAYREWESSLL